MKKEIFESEEELIEEFGEENLICISDLKQNIFYLSYRCLQPLYVQESKTKKGALACWYLKELTKKPYKEWQELKRKEKEK